MNLTHICFIVRYPEERNMETQFKNSQICDCRKGQQISKLKSQYIIYEFALAIIIITVYR